MSTPPRRRASIAARIRSDSGSVTLETVLAFPVIIVAMLAVIQGGLWFHARNVAQVAAEEGLLAARAEGGTGAAGRTRALDVIDQAGAGQMLSGPQVTAVRSPLAARVTVDGRSPSLIPGFNGFAISQTAQGSVERFTTRGDP